MSDEKTPIEDIIESLRQTRDEINLQMHLAKADAKTELEKLERQWDALQLKLKAAGNEAGKAGKDVGSAVKLVAEELAQAYSRVKKKLIK